MAAAVLMVFYVAGASATLPNSPYDGSNGTLDTVTGITTAPDDPSGSSDNAFGQGTKEDNAAVTVVTGSIPPNKNDLTNFYEGSTQTTSGFYIYLGWTRKVNIGNANLDFEINKNPTTVSGSPWSGTTTGSFTINRTAGDILVTYDFGGSGTPTLGVNRWLTSATIPAITGFTTNVCLSSNTFPCWGDHITPVIPNSEASVSSDGLFGEAVINLTGAGIISSSSCDFGQATTFLKSRSSSSFTAELKDFIAPVSTPITSCATLTVIKHTLNAAGTRAASTQSFTFDPSSNLGGGTSFSLTDTGTDTASNTKSFTGLSAGTYTVSEEDPGTSFKLTGVSCVNTGTTTAHGTTSTSSTPNASVTLAAGGDVTCTFENTQQVAAIKITKTSSKAAATPLAGAEFYVCTNNTNVKANCTAPSGVTNPVTTAGTSGSVCVPGLALGTYYVFESKAPGGYSIDDTSANSEAATSAGTCASSGTPSVSDTWTDTPLTDIHVHVQSEATGGTQSNVKCVAGTNPSTGTAIGNSPQPASGNADPVDLYADAGTGHGGGLAPGTYTCTITIDP
ncbi:MAG: prealbumin-like fold domain-containing protein [Gaiellaceae bacterium]